MTQSWKNEKEGQGDSLVSPSGISMIWKVNLKKEEGFFFSHILFHSGFRRQTHRCTTICTSSQKENIRVTTMENVGMPLY